MKNIITKDILDKIGRVDLPTTPDEMNTMFKLHSIDIHDMFHILSKYEEYSDMYIECVYMMLKYGDFNKVLFDALINNLTQGFETGKITESTYYQLIQFAIDNKSYYDYTRKYLEIIDKCSSKFIQDNLGKSISSYHIGYPAIKQYHYLIDWNVFQQYNNIYEILVGAADLYNDKNIVREIITEEYYLNSLDYNIVLTQISDNHDIIDSDILITMLRHPDKFKINNDTVVNYCNHAYHISDKLVNFLINEYKPIHQQYYRHPDVEILCTILNKMDKSRLRNLILKHDKVFFRYEKTQDLIRNMFRWNLKISWKLMTIRPIDR